MHLISFLFAPRLPPAKPACNLCWAHYTAHFSQAFLSFSCSGRKTRARSMSEPEVPTRLWRERAKLLFLLIITPPAEWRGSEHPVLTFSSFEASSRSACFRLSPAHLPREIHARSHLQRGAMGNRRMERE